MQSSKTVVVRKQDFQINTVSTVKSFPSLKFLQKLPSNYISMKIIQLYSQSLIH